jgi:hypothetical protein
MTNSKSLGIAFENAVASALTKNQWDITARNIKVDGNEIDIMATSPLGTPWWFECKGGRRGLACSYVVKEATGTAWSLRNCTYRPLVNYYLVTSRMPKADTLPQHILDDALRSGLFDGAGTVSEMLNVSAGWRAP